jgi:hypothetical protein
MLTNYNYYELLLSYNLLLEICQTPNIETPSPVVFMLDYVLKNLSGKLW